MAAPTERYVDPSIAGDSGSGTSGDPWGDLQYGLNQVTRDATNGDRFNIKAGTDEVLTAAISLASYGTPTNDAPLVFQGYTSAAGDGGIGGINGAGLYSVINNTALDYIYFIDCHLHNSGANWIVSLNDYCGFYNCEFDNATTGGLDLDFNNIVVNCYFHNLDGSGCYIAAGRIYGCTFENGTNDFDYAINVGAQHTSISNNTFDIDGASEAIRLNGQPAAITNNSIYCNSGSGTGISITNGTEAHIITGNIIEGFSSGTAVLFGSNNTSANLVGHNAFYNNSTNYNLGTNNISIDLRSGTDVALSSSPFLDAANDDFRIKPSVKWLAYPTSNIKGLSIRNRLDIGALQRKEWGLVHPGYSGGLQ